MSTEIDNFFKTATYEQKGLLVKLAETSGKEKKLVNEIEGIFGATKEGVYSQSKEYGLIPCEDEDDAKIISGRARRELKTVRAQMAEYMKQAVELNMEHLGIIKRTYKNYVGEEIPVN